MNKIDELILYLQLKNQIGYSIPVTEIISICAALLSFLGLIFTTIYTVKRHTKLNNANARIEWIQNVRTITAKLIFKYNEILNEDSTEEIQKHIVCVREYIEMMILYFGPETDKKTTNNLYNEKTNDGKNDLIINYLIDLSNCFAQYYKNLESEAIKVKKNVLKEQVKIYKSTSLE